MSNSQKKFILEDRTARFGERLIIFCRQVPIDIVTRRIIDQLVRSGTSIGANYMEANGASSRKDFRNKIYLAKKEAQETKHWLRMLASACSDHAAEIRLLWTEAQELTLILQKITSTMKHEDSQ